MGLGRYLTNYDTIIRGFTKNRGGEHHIFKEQLASSTAGCKMGRPGLQRCWKSSCGGGSSPGICPAQEPQQREMGFCVGELSLWVSAAMCAASKRTQDGGGSGEQTQCRRDLSHGPAAAVRDPPLPSIPLTWRMVPLRQQHKY